MSISDKVKSGYWSISTQKHLKVFKSEATGLSQLGNLNLTGKVGRFLGVIRGNGQITDMNKLELMANSVGINNKLELLKIVLPELESASDKRIELMRDTIGNITGIAEYVYDNPTVLGISGQVFENQHPTDVERIVIRTMDETKKIPYAQSHLIQLLIQQGFSERDVSLSIALQNNFKLIRVLNKMKNREPIISNEYVWGDNHEKIAMAVSGLNMFEKDTLREIIDSIQNFQGFPLEKIAPEASNLLLMAKKTGMINPTTIVSTRGFQKDFGFSTNLLQPEQYNNDILDDVKLLLASIRFGENYTPYSTINDPEKFLSKLIQYGDIGPHDANATDYTLLEKKGIVRVVRKQKFNSYYGTYRTGPCLELIRTDVAKEALNIIKNPNYTMNNDAEITDFGSMMDVGIFVTPEEERMNMAEMPETLKEIEEHTLRVLRGENI
ncbi:hypothetical protein [Paenibacillus sp. YIM B09110]|uniref:hypothetical protein n=1 Tax=Paenibacillus sp. YIM B09110 TaxID=3126102 RepID=UPI00301D4BA1